MSALNWVRKTLQPSVALRWHCSGGAIAIILLCLVLTVSPVPAASFDDLLLQAAHFDSQKNFAFGINTYERALQLVAPGQDIERLKIECRIALDYYELKDLVQLEKHGYAALEIFKKLKTQRGASDSALDSMTQLFDAADFGFSTDIPHQQRFVANLKCKILANAICEAAIPKQLTIEKLDALARAYVIVGDYAGCEKQLKTNLKRWECSPRVPIYTSEEAALAEVENLQKRPDRLNKLKSQLGKPTGSVYATTIGIAETWCTEYDKAIKTFNSALDKMKSPKDTPVMVPLLRYIASTYADEARWSDAEVANRKLVALMSHADQNFKKAKEDLVFCLRQQNKNAEADKILPPERGPNGQGMRQYDWFLTDEEKAALAKSEKDKTHNAEQK